ncbi:MAG: hypothetical protein M3Q58_03215 [Bacteroidota bacterium]|nr:hypothetical protein [Bacteroidota bacterium]
MKKDIDYFNEIDSLSKRGLISEAESSLIEFSNKVNNNPDYSGHFWRAKAYDSLDKKRNAQKVLEDLNSASKYLPQMNQETLPIPALILKARAHHFLQQDEQGILTCNEILKKGPEKEVYFIRAVLNNKIGNEEDFFRDCKKSADLGHKPAIQILSKMNSKKK